MVAYNVYSSLNLVYQLDYSDLEQEQIYQAMELAFNGDESILANLILEHLESSD